MATTRAIEATTSAVVELLRDVHLSEDFSRPLAFEVYAAADFEDGTVADGVSLYLYKVEVSGAGRHPAGRVLDNGRRQLTKLPLDLRLLLTPWGATTSLQHAVLGWAMRVLEDFPVLPAGMLNRNVGEVFHSGESVELAPDDVPNEELLHLWEVLAPSHFHLSVPYVARGIVIESGRTLQDAELVQERFQRHGLLRGSS